MPQNKSVAGCRVVQIWGVVVVQQQHRALPWTVPSPAEKRGGWEAAGPRIIYASFKTKKENIKVNIIQCYAPTNDKDEETKEDFYNKLQTLCDKLKEKDMTILMGDLNAKIGSDNSGYEEVMGRQGLGKMN
ncbi:hypothetical protein NP493_1142g00003 [Ridgeia piscesae]|uniref:Endonuclease/exonuclease/phosphatase domain-containing protein n=1 Tax=Ridgeia piscesae TaxID=27915 RepID=A0AAD9KGI9_RIDPI|nr:hypothetical protein NP493_1142g00003 [Ridgeia piscesae]